MPATLAADPTDRTLRRLRAVVLMRDQDRNHTGRMLIHTQQADALLDDLLALHPEMRWEVARMAGHRYLSTACLHQEHSRCRIACKYCPAPCVCPCHRGDTAQDDPTVTALRRIALGEAPAARVG